jgi:redox-sensitive bicupin YhaK (pirin superfamily)
MPAGAELALPSDVAERAAYVAEGAVTIADRAYAEGTLAVARTGTPITLRASTASRVMVVGGEPLGQRHIWWNFVSSSKERIEQAKQDWAAGRMGKVPGDDEFIPLPDR